MREPIPILLVTGFLGSGKTTLLLQLAKQQPEKRLIFLVNEFANANLDGLRLDTTGRPCRSVIGGSLFCECKSADFIRVLKEEVVPAHAETRLDALVIETSGIANPAAISSLLRTHGLEPAFRIVRIITVLAPRRFPALLENLPAVRAQIESSDLVIMNKLDTVDTSGADHVAALVSSVNPAAEQVRTSFCDVNLSLDGDSRLLPDAPLSKAEANPYSATRVTWPPDRSVDALRQWLRDLPATILRIKGEAVTPEGSWYINRTVDSLDIEPLDTASPAGLVLLAHDDHARDLDVASASLQTRALA
jgi:G3E family GTPase